MGDPYPSSAGGWQEVRRKGSRKYFRNSSQVNLEGSARVDVHNTPRVAPVQSTPTTNENPKPRALDLFSGTGSVASHLTELSYEVMTLEIKRTNNPTFHLDITEWDYRTLPRGYFQLIAASPPCTEYSTAKTTAPRNLELADKLVAKTLEIIGYFQPDFWWLEILAGVT